MTMTMIKMRMMKIILKGQEVEIEHRDEEDKEDTVEERRSSSANGL